MVEVSLRHPHDAKAPFVGTALHKVQSSFTARLSHAGGGESSHLLLATGIRSSPMKDRNCAKCLIFTVTLWTLHPALLLTEEGSDAKGQSAGPASRSQPEPRVGGLVSAWSSDAQTLYCLPTVPTAF